MTQSFISITCDLPYLSPQTIMFLLFILISVIHDEEITNAVTVTNTPPPPKKKIK